MKQKKPFSHRQRTMKALIIYDDVAAARRAIAILRRASCLSKMRLRWDIKPCRAEVLGLPIAADEALLEAICAEVIVLADLSGVRQIWLMDWLKCWSALRQSAESALVVTRANPDGKVSAISRELSSFAAQNRLDLMIEANCAVRIAPVTSVLDAAKEGSPVVPVSAEAPPASENYSYRGWGINE